MVVLDEALVMAALESRAGTLDEATVNKMDGTGWRVGKTARGLPNVGREIESGEEIGWTSVGKEEDDASLMCFETSWFLESDRQPPSQTRIWDQDSPVAVITPSLLMLADTKRRLSSVKLPSLTFSATPFSTDTNVQHPSASTTRHLECSGREVVTWLARIGAVDAVLAPTLRCCDLPSSGETSENEEAE
jgi:hypothetical protein